jgi:hypothetical protein
MNLKQRLENLERESASNEPIILRMPNGQVKKLPGNQVISLLGQATRPERTGAMDLIAQSLSSTEPGGGQLIDLARAILNSPQHQEPSTT